MWGHTHSHTHTNTHIHSFCSTRIHNCCMHQLLCEHGMIGDSTPRQTPIGEEPTLPRQGKPGCEEDGDAHKLCYEKGIHLRLLLVGVGWWCVEYPCDLRRSRASHIARPPPNHNNNTSTEGFMHGGIRDCDCDVWPLCVMCVHTHTHTDVCEEGFL